MTSTLPLGIVAASRAPSGAAFGLVETKVGGAESNTSPYVIPYTQPIEAGDFIIYVSFYYAWTLEYSALTCEGLGTTWTRDNFATQQAVAPTANMWWGVAQSASVSGGITVGPHVYRSGGWYWNIRGANPASFQYELSNTATSPLMSAGPNAFVGVNALENSAAGPIANTLTPSSGWVQETSASSARWGAAATHRMVGDETANHQIAYSGTPKSLIFKLEAA